MSNMDTKVNIIIKILVIVILLAALLVGAYYSVTVILKNLEDENIKESIVELEKQNNYEKEEIKKKIINHEKQVLEYEEDISALEPAIDAINKNIDSELDNALYPYLQGTDLKYWSIMISFGFQENITDFKRSPEYINMPEDGKKSFDNYLRRVETFRSRLDSKYKEIDRINEKINDLEQEIYFLNKELDE